ncbi:MAG TPA: hypothetical protein DGT21_05255 [Armatimonadetes bacterium]|jgi:hypothetical protein|nr:hypothetical protein [Armatimonadota bacterium]
MLRSLEVENYRGFEKYRMDGLARVNLLVGDNGVGKTALLEAAQLLGSFLTPYALQYITMHRGEFIPGSGGTGPLSAQDASLTGLFHGRHAAPRSTIRIAAPSDGVSLTLTILPMADEQAREHAQLYLDQAVTDAVYMLLIERVLPGERRDTTALPLRERMGMSTNAPQHHRQAYVGENPATTLGPHFLPTESLNSDGIRQFWNELIEQGRDEELVPALGIVVPGTERISCLTERARGDHWGALAGFLVTIGDGGPPVPLGSLGEGASRMLTLAASILAAERGDLVLIDEIDTGLHYSRMARVWHLVIRTAIEHDVQVFATTHSLDCIRGLAWCCESHPELASEVALHKIEPRLDKAVPFPAQDIIIADEQGIEVR